LGNIELAPPKDKYALIEEADIPDAPTHGDVTHPVTGADAPPHGVVTNPVVGGGVLDAPHCKLTPHGDVVARRIADTCHHYENIEIPHYMIMPNHVHMIILISDNKGNGTSSGENGTSKEKNGTSRTPSPTNAVIPAFVSTLKRFTNKEVGFSLWQRSFHDHIIRDERDYNRIAEYIENNPQNWRDDCFYVGEGGSGDEH
jgi:REP element-mobilizing transposase RayT